MIVRTKPLASSTALLACLFAFTSPASGQDRRVAAPAAPRPPSVQAPEISPTSQAMAALNLKIDQLRQSVGRQVVVFHFTPTETGGWPDNQNSFPANNERAETICKEALGDRYGRVLSRKARPNGDRWYFSHVVCETAP